MTFTFLLVVTILSAALFGKVRHFIGFESRSIEQEMALHIADAALDFAAYTLQRDVSWKGVASTNLGEGQYEINVINISPTKKNIQVGAYVPNKFNPRAKRLVSMDFEPAPIFVPFTNLLATFSTTQGDITLAGNAVDQTGGNLANVHSSRALNIGSFSVQGVCKYRTTLTPGPSNCTNGGQSAGAYPAPGYSTTPFNGCATWYNYWEASAKGSPPTGDLNCIPPYPTGAGTTTCTSGDGNDCVFGGVSQSWNLGPQKYVGDVHLVSNSFTNVKGVLFITGDLNLTTFHQIRIDQSYADQDLSVPVIVQGKINLSSYGVGGNCITRKVSSTGFYVYLLFVTPYSGSGQAITVGCSTYATYIAENGNLCATTGATLPTLHGAAAAYSMLNPSFACPGFGTIVYDNALPNMDIGADPTTLAGWKPKKGTYTILKDSNFQSDLVGWWKADGNFNNSSGTGNNGTMGGTVTFAAGKFDQAFNIQTLAGYDNVNLGDHDDYTPSSNQLTVMGWLKRDQALTGALWNIIVSKHNGNGSPYPAFQLGIEGTGVGTPSEAFFSVFDANALSWGNQAAVKNADTFATRTDWIHVAGTYNGSQICVYVDGGAYSNCQSKSHAILNNTVPVKIGECCYASFVIDGLIDNVKIYKRALTQAEILNEYQNGP